MKTLLILIVALIPITAVSAEDALTPAEQRQAYVREKEAILQKICQACEDGYRNGTVDYQAAAEARKTLLEFKRDAAVSDAERIKCQKSLIAFLQKEYETVMTQYKSGGVQQIDVYKALLPLMDGKEHLRQLEER